MYACHVFALVNVGDSCVCKGAMGLASNNEGSVKLRPARIMHASIRLGLSLMSLAKNDTPLPVYPRAVFGFRHRITRTPATTPTTNAIIATAKIQTSPMPFCDVADCGPVRVTLVVKLVVVLKVIVLSVVLMVVVEVVG